MTNIHTKICPVCAEGALHPDQKMVAHQIDGVACQIPQKFHWCDVCGMEFGLAEDARFNARAYRSAEQNARGRLTGNDIRTLRKKIGVTQEVAGKLFGGGPVAFCKYEKDDLTPSEPMDNLLWLIQNFPDLVNHLASRHRIEGIGESKTSSNPRVTYDISSTRFDITKYSGRDSHLLKTMEIGEGSHVNSVVKADRPTKKAEVQEDNWSRSGKFPYLAHVANTSNTTEPMNDEIFEMTRRLVGANRSWTAWELAS